MDTSRISFGEMVAAVSGAALMFVMFVFDWFSYEEDPASVGYSAWQWMSFLDIVLFVCALVAIALAVLRASGEMPQLPAPPGLIVAGAGALALVIILFRLLIPGDGPLDELVAQFGGDVTAERKVGLFLGLVAAGGIAFGGYTAMNERASGAAPPAGGSPPPPSAPPSAPPPPPAPEPPASQPPTV